MLSVIRPLIIVAKYYYSYTLQLLYNFKFDIYMSIISYKALAGT